MKTWTTIAAIAAAMAVAGVAPQPVTLKRNAKVGETNVYHMTMVLFTQGLEVNVTYVSSEEVIKVGSDGSYTSVLKQTDQVAEVGGTPVGGGEDGEGILTYAADGEVTKIESDQLDNDGYRRTNLMNIIWPPKPVDVGSKWESTLKADPGKIPYDIVKTFRILAREEQMGRDTFKVKTTVVEKGGQASGEATLWIEVKTGVLVKAVGELTNAPMPGGMMDATFTAELQD